MVREFLGARCTRLLGSRMATTSAAMLERAETRYGLKILKTYRKTNPTSPEREVGPELPY